MSKNTIEFTHRAGEWDRDQSFLLVHEKQKAPCNIIQFQSKDRFGTEFDLFEVLDFFNIRPDQPVGGWAWEALIGARLAKFGFINLVRVSKREYGQYTHIHFEYEQENRYFTLSCIPYTMKTVVARSVPNPFHTEAVYRIPVKEDGNIDVPAVKALGIPVTLVGAAVEEETYLLQETSDYPSRSISGQSNNDHRIKVSMQLCEQAVQQGFTWNDSERGHLWFNIISVE